MPTNLPTSMLETVAYLGGGFTTLGAGLAQVGVTEGHWIPLALQAGMAGIVVLLLLKFFPDLLKAQKEQNDRYLNALEKQRDAHDKATQSVLESHRIAVDRVLAGHSIALDRITDSHKAQMEQLQTHLVSRIGDLVRAEKAYQTAKQGD